MNQVTFNYLDYALGKLTYKRIAFPCPFQISLFRIIKTNITTVSYESFTFGLE